MSGRSTRNAWSGADNMARAAQFRSNPNLVIERKKDPEEKEPDRAKEPNGEAETLVGRISLKQMTMCLFMQIVIMLLYAQLNLQLMHVK